MDHEAILARTEHRPWPLPRGRCVMYQGWYDLLFAHWPLAPELVRALVPPQLELDLFENEAWVGVVPFRMAGIRLLPLPALPGTSAFPELNLRTYVTMQGKPGVFFFSLDAAHRLAVAVARRWFRLPYFFAAMGLSEDEAGIHYESKRVHRGAPSAEFVGRYRPIAPPSAARPGSLEHYLVERYCLYASDGSGRVRRGNIHHLPWPLQPAEAELSQNTLARASGLELPQKEPLLHFARRLDVLIWGLESTDSGR